MPYPLTQIKPLCPAGSELGGYPAKHIEKGEAKTLTDFFIKIGRERSGPFFTVTFFLFLTPAVGYIPCMAHFLTLWDTL